MCLCQIYFLLHKIITFLNGTNLYRRKNFLSIPEGVVALFISSVFGFLLDFVGEALTSGLSVLSLATGRPSSLLDTSLIKGISELLDELSSIS
jgi:hypothetical protein